MNGLSGVVALGLVAAFWTTPALPQANVDARKKDDLYSIALVASITEMQKSWGHINDGGSGKPRTDYRNMVVRKNSEITDDLSSEFGDHRLEYLDDQGLIAKYKVLRKEFPVLVVHPVSNDGDRLKIQISVYWFSYRHKRLLFALSDWSDVEFRHDCAKQAFAISSVKLGGI